jgi:hypothetical protein
MNKKDREELYWIFRELASEIRELKENECGNSGENWHERFMRVLRVLESVHQKTKRGK